MDRGRRPHRAAGLVRRGGPDALRSAACGQRPRLDRRPGPVSGPGDPARSARLALARRRRRGLAAVLDLPRADPRSVLTAAGWTERRWPSGRGAACCTLFGFLGGALLGCGRPWRDGLLAGAG